MLVAVALACAPRAAVTPAQPSGEILIEWRDAGSTINQHQCQICFVQRPFCLLLHASFQTANGGIFQTGCVEQAKAQLRDASHAFAPVSGHARAIIY